MEHQAETPASAYDPMEVLLGKTFDEMVAGTWPPNDRWAGPAKWPHQSARPATEAAHPQEETPRPVQLLPALAA